MSDDASLFAKLRAGKVPLREILDMAKGPREDDVYASRETCTEVLRQLAGHCEHLIALSQGKTNLRAAVYDLERRFANWQELEAEKAREYAAYQSTAEGMQRQIDVIRNMFSDLNERVSENYDELSRRLPPGEDDDE